MDIAIAIFNLGKMGGLERHCVRLAENLLTRGHSVMIYTTASASILGSIPLKIVSRRGHTNHSRMDAFADDLRIAMNGRHDLVIACQKFHGADVLFCADWCLAERNMPAWKKLLPRYRTLLRLERACCGPESNMFLIMLSEPQAAAYRNAWSIAPHRMTVIPPSLDSRLMLEAVNEEARSKARHSRGLGRAQTAWLWVGMQPMVKGLDRAIEALALSQDIVLLAAGADPKSRIMRQLSRKAEKLDCADRLKFIGLVSGVELIELYQAADLLIHPSRLDITGNVIVEALGVGLPVITTENCGFSAHVRTAEAGVVLRESAQPLEIVEAGSVSSEVRSRWAKNAREYVRTTNLTAGIDAAANAIEEFARTVGGVS